MDLQQYFWRHIATDAAADSIDVETEKPSRKATSSGVNAPSRARSAIIDTYGSESVSTVIHRVLVDNEPFRTATNGLEIRNVDGVWIGTGASWFLEALNAQADG